jgi:predicted DNA-binding transcriptional regulator AlpA
MDANERLLRLADVIGDRKKGIPGLIPMSRSKFYELIKCGIMPPPLHIGCNSYWKRNSVMAVIDKTTA